METSAIGTSTVSASSFRADRITAVAREFEALFSSIMLKAMRRTIGEGALVPRSIGERIYTEMLDNEYAKLMGCGGRLGLAGLVEKELREHEERSISTSGLRTAEWILDYGALSPDGLQLPQQSITDYRQLLRRIEEYNEPISRASEESGVDRNLIAAVIARESGGNRYAVSRAGAKGLMQLMDSTAHMMGVTSLFDPEQNIRGGTLYLRSLLERFNGDERLALASYNAGPSAVEKYSGIPPYRETQNYVRSVLELRSRFAELTNSMED